MSAVELCITYRPESDWDGQLEATVTSGSFSGTGSAWFSPQHVKETFIAALRTNPLSTSDPPMLEGGFWSKEKPGALDQCHLRIAIRPYNARGSLLVQVDVASDWSSTPDKDRQQPLTSRFVTEYAALAAFASDFEQVLDGKRELAILSGVGG